MTEESANLMVAKAANTKLIQSIEKRSIQPGTVIGPCITSYVARINSDSEEHPLDNLTRHLTETLEITAGSIRTRMEAKHVGNPNSASKVESSVRNSLMRSAGTNYQGLVSYAIARYLLKKDSAWYVQHPVPADFGQSLSIRFGSQAGFESTGEQPEAAVVIKPDVDILVRNASWLESKNAPEPVLILSVKTSLADRAGSAARWKTYFDIATNPCAHACEEDCAYRSLGISLENNPNVNITHGIVTANIYKMNSDAEFALRGELGTNQARSNTFMFDLRYATRNDQEELAAPGWAPLSGLPVWLSSQSEALNLGQ